MLHLQDIKHADRGRASKVWIQEIRQQSQTNGKLMIIKISCRAGFAIYTYRISNQRTNPLLNYSHGQMTGVEHDVVPAKFERMILDAIDTLPLFVYDVVMVAGDHTRPKMILTLGATSAMCRCLVTHHPQVYPISKLDRVLCIDQAGKVAAKGLDHSV